MARRRKWKAGEIFTGIVGCIIFAGFSASPLLGTILATIAVVLFVAANWKGSCDLCSQRIARKSFRWSIDGKSKKLCANCNLQLERKKSAAAIRNLGW